MCKPTCNQKQIQQTCLARTASPQYSEMHATYAPVNPCRVNFSLCLQTEIILLNEEQWWAKVN